MFTPLSSSLRKVRKSAPRSLAFAAISLPSSHRPGEVQATPVGRAGTVAIRTGGGRPATAVFPTEEGLSRCPAAGSKGALVGASWGDEGGGGLRSGLTPNATAHTTTPVARSTI